MDDVTLRAKTRKKKSKEFREQRDKLTPGVVYGKTHESVPLAIDAVELEKAYSEVGRSKVIDLLIDDKKKPVKVLFHEMQHDPIKGSISHFDLYAVTLGEKLQTEVPIHFEGTPQAVVSAIGDLVTIMDEISVEANPMDLPESFTVNLEHLAEIGDGVHVSDLQYDKSKVEVLDDPEELIAKIDPPRETPEEEEPLGDEMEEPELIGEEESEEGEGSEEAEGEEGKE